jgi:hypothetical protein
MPTPPVPNVLSKAEANAIKVDEPGGKQLFNLPTPGSLEAKASRDPVLRARIDAGRKQAYGDLNVMEAWAAGDFTAGLPVL